jgi:hypothetical protein
VTSDPTDVGITAALVVAITENSKHGSIAGARLVVWTRQRAEL